MIFALVSLGIIARPLLAQKAYNGSPQPPASAAESVEHGEGVQIEDLHPFTHFASIPASTNPATIKFEKVKATKVYTRLRSTMDIDNCNELRSGKTPGGSMYCPLMEDESAAPVYEVTYSYDGEPLSAKTGGGYFTFHVYFHPGELSPALRRAISEHKTDRAELATNFNVTTSRLPVRVAVTDESQSTFCDGNYVDGEWAQTDPNCKDKIIGKFVSERSGYRTVRVDPVLPRDSH
jgi:hypothetical protein